MKNNPRKAGAKLIVVIILFLLALGVAWLVIFNYFVSKDLNRKALGGIAWFGFDNKNALQGWEEKIIKGKVLYNINTSRADGYLNALSKGSASGIIYWLKFNPKIEPMVSWKWRVSKFPDKKSSAKEDNWWVEKDDYAARFYVIFPKFPFFRLHCLEYVWDDDLPKGTILKNPNFNNLRIIVIESGSANLGKWVSVERNIYDDYKKVFGKEPGSVGAIALMTDADNTASQAEAQYDEIRVGYGRQ